MQNILHLGCTEHCTQVQFCPHLFFKSGISLLLMNKVLCFGELLLRFSPDVTGEWLLNNAMPVFVGGSELNVATALAKWKTPVGYCTALPNNFLATQILKSLNKKNVDASSVLLNGNRIGIYYLTQGTDVKNAGVIYDRANSSFSQVQKGMIDWDNTLKEISWFHFSAICPAISQQVADVCGEALQACVKRNITVSVDLNYRSKLWQYGKQPHEVMPGLMKYCSVVMGNLWAAESLLLIPSSIKESAGRTNDELQTAAGQSMLQLHQQYANVTTIAYTYRLENKYWAMIQHGKDLAISKQHEINGVVDKVGSGDCFMAGLIYGLYNKHSLHRIADFAAAAAVGKLYEKGDATEQTIEQVNARY